MLLIEKFFAITSTTECQVLWFCVVLVFLISIRFQSWLLQYHCFTCTVLSRVLALETAALSETSIKPPLQVPIPQKRHEKKRFSKITQFSQLLEYSFLSSAANGSEWSVGLFICFFLPKKKHVQLHRFHYAMIISNCLVLNSHPPWCDPLLVI